MLLNFQGAPQTGYANNTNLIELCEKFICGQFNSISLVIYEMPACKNIQIIQYAFTERFQSLLYIFGDFSFLIQSRKRANLKFRNVG